MSGYALGHAEKVTLKALAQLGGEWHKESGWVWESRHWTLRILEGLERKGLVQLVTDGRFKLTKKGQKAADEIS